MTAPARIAAVAASLAAAALLLSGCAPKVPLQPAEASNDPLCAEVSVRTPDELADQPKRETDAQATAAWGEPATVILRCGVEVPGPSELPCVLIDGIQWLRDDSDAPNLVFRTFGREPAVDVAIENGPVSPGVVLSELSSVVGYTEPTSLTCQTLEDTVTGEPGPGDDGAAEDGEG